MAYNWGDQIVTFLVLPEDGVSKYQILARAAKPVESNVDLACAAVNGMILLHLQRAGSRQEVRNNIPDLCGAVNTLERGRLEFPHPTAK